MREKPDVERIYARAGIAFVIDLDIRRNCSDKVNVRSTMCLCRAPKIVLPNIAIALRMK